MKVDQSTECSAIVEFDDLDSSTTWYHRTYLHNSRKGFDGAAAGFCVKGISKRTRSYTALQKSARVIHRPFCLVLKERWLKMQRIRNNITNGKYNNNITMMKDADFCKETNR